MARPEGTKEERETVRKRAIALLNNGYSPEKVAELADVTRQSVYRWKKAYEKEGANGIEAIPNTGGRTPKLPNEKLPELEELLLEGPRAHGFERQTWSYPAIANVIEQEFGVSVSPSTARRYLLTIGLNSKELNDTLRNRDEQSNERREKIEETSYRQRGSSSRKRVTMRIPRRQIEEVERMVEAGEYSNRSEAIRSAVREMLVELDASQDDSAAKRRRRGWKR